MQDGTQFPRLPKRTIELPPRQFVSFPATGILGLLTRAWLWWLRAYLNRERYRLQVYGRSPKTPQDRGSAGRVKLTRAKRWGLYLDDKFQTEFDTYHREIGEHEAARHYRNQATIEVARADALQVKWSQESTAYQDSLNTLQEQADILKDKARNLRAQVGELVTVAADRLVRNQRLTERANTLHDERNRWKERCDVRADVLHKIRAELSGKEWSADTPQEVAAILQANGYHIEGYDPAELTPINGLNAHREPYVNPPKITPPTEKVKS